MISGPPEQGKGWRIERVERTPLGDVLLVLLYTALFGALKQACHPYMDEGPSTDELLVGDVPLHIGQAMTFHFDFGDDWMFRVTLESVDPKRVTHAPEILEAHGEPPKQYRSWDE